LFGPLPPDALRISRTAVRNGGMTVGIIANSGKEGARVALNRLSQVLAVRGIPVLLERQAAVLCGLPGGMEGPDLAAASDVVAVLGGDGTMLNAVAMLGRTDKPVAGINIGNLG